MSTLPKQCVVVAVVLAGVVGVSRGEESTKGLELGSSRVPADQWPAYRRDAGLTGFSPLVGGTAGPLVYLGTLEGVCDEGFRLSDADVHNRDDGQATHELYLIEARRHGHRPNRGRVLVLRSVVTSVSRLDAVLLE